MQLKNLMSARPFPEAELNAKIKLRGGKIHIDTLSEYRGKKKKEQYCFISTT